MNGLESLMAQTGLEALGWALLHFLWQGALVAILLAVVMRLLRKHSANLRYVVACASLLFMMVLPVGTFWWMSRSIPSAPVESATVSALEVGRVATERVNSIEGGMRRASVDAKPQTWQQWLYERFEGLMPWFMFAWLVGVLAMSLKLMGGAVYVQRLKRKHTRPVDSRWQKVLNRLAERLRVMKPVRLVESSLVRAPMAIGWLRPVVLLPASALTGLTPRQLEAILAHELAHIRRHDYLINLFQTIIETLLFYHPAVWWVSRQVRIERENCCDDMAVAVCGDALVYARALTRVERLRRAAPQLAMAADGGSLMNRINRIVGVQSPRSNRFAGLLAGVIAIMAVVAVVAGAQIRTIPTPVGDLSEQAVLGNPHISQSESMGVRAATAETGNPDDDSARQGDQTGIATPADSDTGDANSIESPQPFISILNQDDLPPGAAESIKALSSRSPDERAAAACSLGKLEAVAAIPLLINMLGDDSALEIPTRCWEGGRWSPAVQVFKNPSPGESAAIALAAMSQPAVRPLVEALDSENSTVRRNAAWAIGEIRGGIGTDRSAAVEPLIIALNDYDSWVRKAAARALGEIRDRRATDALVTALGDADSSVRQTAAWALGDMKNRGGVEGLIAVLLRDTDWKVRQQSAWALGEIRDRQAVDALNSALSDENERVRRRARWALSEILD
ncbi:MAG: M56 family metallopeptidase [Blastocatellia bacterium]|nr:M56 family metallopeptidase [Blastocatellia bacterium]